jgi:signal transduction histidine kinase/response regulator RpfG family c-di-GMP phosphodiesterase
MDKPLKLLVVDDDAADRMLLKRALSCSGFEYQLAAYEDIHKVSEDLDEFDCIFLDYLLPGENGLSLLKRFREGGIKTPVIVITSQGDESIAVELMKAGVSDYIIKNEINGQSIAMVLRNMLWKREMIQEREEAERALRISESRLAEAQRIAKIGNWEYVPLTDKLYWSPELYNLLGLDEKNTIPTIDKFVQSLYPEDKFLMNQVWTSALQGKAFSFDFRIVTPLGLRHMHAQGYSICNSSGGSDRIVGTLQDITERKLAEQEISKARELAESSIKVKEIFLANMSHEIRTPMNAILGFTRLLFETELSKEQKGFIDAIHFSGENLLVIINDILDLSKLQSGKMTIEKCEFNVYDLINGIVTVLRPKAQEKGLKLMSMIHSMVPSMIIGDPVRLNQILTNLITNAIKFTEKGTVSIDVNAFATTEHEEISLEFKVKDSGIGIPIDKQPQIFESFVQASADTTRKYGGTGLGLSIVKSLVALQDGKITLESQPGQGSTFTVHIPFIKSKTSKNSSSDSAVVESNTLEHIRGSAILVVEDNPVNQLLVKKVLGKTGCNVDIASNGIEGLELIKTKRYDVILMDIQMPEMDGYQTTYHIRNNLPQALSGIPIIALTAHAFGPDVTKCIAAGMNDYISKPFKAEDLYAKISKHCQKEERARIINLNQSNEVDSYNVNLSSISSVEHGDVTFLNELILAYDKQTPAFVDRLRGYVKSHNWKGIAAVCDQIKSAYDKVKMKELDKAIEELKDILNTSKPEADLPRVANMVNVIVSLISALNEEVKRNLRKTG